MLEQKIRCLHVGIRELKGGLVGVMNTRLYFGDLGASRFFTELMRQLGVITDRNAFSLGSKGK